MASRAPLIRKALSAGRAQIDVAREVGVTRQYVSLVAATMKAADRPPRKRRPITEAQRAAKGRSIERGLRIAQVKALAALGMGPAAITVLLELRSRGAVSKIIQRRFRHPS